MKKSSKRVVKVISILIVLTIVLFLSFNIYSDVPLEDLKAKYAQGSSTFITVNGLEVHYRDEGIMTDSIPIILIHGTGSSLHTYDNWSDRLVTKHRVIRMDLPAYGLTGPFPHKKYTIPDYVKFINDFLFTLDIKKCIIAGNSFGGEIAWNYTYAHPEIIEKLILINSAGYPNDPKSAVPMAFKLARTPIIGGLTTYITPRFIIKSSIENLYADKSKVNNDLVDRYFELSLRPGNRRAFVDRIRTTSKNKSYKNIKSIRHKTLLLWGQEDKLFPISIANRFQEDLPNATLVILKDIGHMPMEESPEQSLEPVLAFLH